MGNKHFHFIGISGIGMSGIAKILKQQGYIVSGCDKAIDPKHTQELVNLGCSIATKHLDDICLNPSITTLIYNSQIPLNHPELQRTKKTGIPIMHRADMLAQIMSQKISIGVAGSHGKTSTTALIGHMLLGAKLNPSIIVGGHINSLNSNAIHNCGKYLVAETDESDRSLLKLPKTYAVITNIDLEHLETYRDLNDIKQTFLTFINNTPMNGCNIICLDDPGIQSIQSKITAPYTTYGTNPQADIQIQDIKLEKDSSSFNVFHKNTRTLLGSITIPIAGIHYALNAAGTIALGLTLGIPFITMQETLKTFAGVDRRFTHKGKSKNHDADIFDDYGHHPQEIDHVLKVARKKCNNKLIVVFQPHRYSRTKHLWNDFMNTFSHHLIDVLIITDIYEASETPIQDVNSQNFVKNLQALNPQANIIYCPMDPEQSALQSLIESHLEKDDLLLFLGAGKVHKIAENLL